MNAVHRAWLDEQADKDAGPQHTPGRWIVESFGRRYEVATEDYLVTIATVRRFGGREQANAALIAAAPDLLEALRTTAKNIRSWKATKPGVVTMDAWLEVVEDAIAKTTGGAE